MRTLLLAALAAVLLAACGPGGIQPATEGTPPYGRGGRSEGGPA